MLLTAVESMTIVVLCSLVGAEIVTFLPLQVVLYFNVFYSPLWVIACIFTLENKVKKLIQNIKVSALFPASRGLGTRLLVLSYIKQ